MQNCLGIYIEDNIIEYAKLQKEKDSIKVESYNIAFYDNDLEETLKRIISETYSYKTPISINVSNEIYNTFEISSLLGKQDTKKAVDIEYEMLCSEEGYNRSLLEHNYIINFPKESQDTQKVISIIANKNDISRRVEALGNTKIDSMTPITTTITNLVDNDGEQNIAIVNIENKTKITTMIDGQICQIDVLEEGMGTILERINRTENSLAKSYEACKNVTIYAQNSTDIYSENNEYVDIITTVLLDIATKTRKIISEMFSNIDKIYITGLGACINNIDLFFQDYITSAKCEVLRPYFLDGSSLELPIKEYIEVNSATALALNGLGMLDKSLNFARSTKTAGGKSKSGSILTQEVSLDSIKEWFSNFGEKTKNDFSAPFSSSEKLLTRAIISCVMLVIVFIIFSHIISKQLETKIQQTETAIASTNTELGKLDTDINTISTRINTYEQLIKDITEEPDTSEEQPQASERIIAKDSIPNLLNRIMFVIPKKVKLNSIKNTTSNHIVINAEAEKYEQLGYFKAVLTTNGILQNVKSTSGEKTGTTVQVIIEGDLP